MILYHGSPIGELTELKPFLSEHGKPYIYFATNPLVALLYAVKPVPKPFSFYPYGFDNEGRVIFSEYYEDAFCDLYKGKRGYLYSCCDLSDVENPTQINCAYACTEAVKVDGVIEIPDLYSFYKEKEGEGLFRIKPFDQISEKERNFVHAELRHDIDKYSLKNEPEHAMSVFIRRHFPGIWDKS